MVGPNISVARLDSGLALGDESHVGSALHRTAFGSAPVVIWADTLRHPQSIDCGLQANSRASLSVSRHRRIAPLEPH